MSEQITSVPPAHPSGLSARGDFYAPQEVCDQCDVDVTAIVPGDVEMTPAERKALACDEINRLEAFLLSFDQLAYPLAQCFIPKNNGLDSGVYLREVFLPAGAVYTTQIHRTMHPFVLKSGRVRVWTPGQGWTEIKAPYTGITPAATRRVIDVLEPASWLTIHATNETNPDKALSVLVLPHQIVCKNPRLLDGAKLLEALK